MKIINSTAIIKYSFFCVIMFVKSTYSLAQWGDDWFYVTQKGTKIESYDGLIELSSTKHKVAYLNRWYYYHDNILGEYRTQYYDSTLHYFIYNEDTDSVFLFDKLTDWEKERFKMGLSPSIYTKWHFEHSSGNDLVLWLILGFYFTIPCVLLCCLILYFAIVHEKFKLFKPMTMLTYLLVLLIVIYNININWINSI